MGMTRVEAEVCDLWDRGFTTGKIAVQLGVKPKRVRNILATFGPTDEARVDRKMIAQGSSRLASAILALRAS